MAGLKFIYSEKATKFCKIFNFFLTTVDTAKSKVKISQNFVAFSEYMNFTIGNSSNFCSLLILVWVLFMSNDSWVFWGVLAKIILRKCDFRTIEILVKY